MQRDGLTACELELVYRDIDDTNTRVVCTTHEVQTFTVLQGVVIACTKGPLMSHVGVWSHFRQGYRTQHDNPPYRILLTLTHLEQFTLNFRHRQCRFRGVSTVTSDLEEPLGSLNIPPKRWFTPTTLHGVIARLLLVFLLSFDRSSAIVSALLNEERIKLLRLCDLCFGTEACL
jgi:hypothetical protein